MSIIGRFIIGLIAGGIILSVVSIAWPKFTTIQRPEILQQIDNAVKDTPVGRQLGQVLGVSDDQATRPFDLQSFATDLKNWAATQVQNQAEVIITRQAVNQISGSFDKLNETEKAILREAICRPATESARVGK